MMLAQCRETEGE